MTIKFLKVNSSIFLQVLFFLNFLIFNNDLLGQDIYSLDNSKKYAEFLLSSSQFKFATEEFERLVFMDSTDSDLKYKLIYAYRKSGENETGISRLKELSRGQLNTMPQNLSVEYLYLLLNTGKIIEADIFLKDNLTLSNLNNSVFKTCNLFLAENFREANSYVKYAKDNIHDFPVELSLISAHSEKIRFKSPLIAAGLSAIVPGTGKAYTGNYVDGLISLLFVAGNTWQSYKGFSRNGIESVSGWIFGGISLGFYVGNIYGSAKAAKRYNKLKVNETKNQIYNFLYNYSY